ncbi:MAG: energy transducer TonB [Bacteroidota bacterium]
MREHLRYPKQALAQGVEGTVKVEYSINQAGKVIKAKATEGPKDGCREEAVRLVKLLRFSVPKDYKMTVQYHQHLNINFKLPKQKTRPKSQPTKISYTLTPTPQKQEEQNTPQKSGGYGYTIKW